MIVATCKQGMPRRHCRSDDAMGCTSENRFTNLLTLMAVQLSCFSLSICCIPLAEQAAVGHELKHEAYIKSTAEWSEGIPTKAEPPPALTSSLRSTQQDTPSGTRSSRPQGTKHTSTRGQLSWGIGTLHAQHTPR